MKKTGLNITRFSLDRPWLVMLLVMLPTLVLILLAGLPSVWPNRFPWLNAVKVDTDPENMLSSSTPVRVFHDEMKEKFSLYDMVVVGVVNDAHPEGVFNPASLQRIYELAEFAESLQWPHPQLPEKRIGVVTVDILAPSTVDNIESGGEGTVSFEWLMPRPPSTLEEALEIRRKAQRLPFYNGTLVSEDGQAICIYLPLTSKDLSYRVYTQLQAKIDTFTGTEQFHITGLPVAEDTFGVEMFKQMAISAPLAMLAIFLLMLVFFRKLSLIVSPLVLAMVSVIWTMSLLIITGRTIHIMSSMIPIFIMPIAVLDAVHILSMFFDRYQQTRDRRETTIAVMDALFMPMLYTSLTSAAGFASLALTPIPPVQVFGLFCAFGIMVAWVLTITFIPSFIALLPEAWLRNFGHPADQHEAPKLLSRLLLKVGRFTYAGAMPILIAAVLIVVVAVYGMLRIRVNDNPTKWFEPDHPIRIADRVLNEHFGGTYMTYLGLSADDEITGAAEYSLELADELSRQSAAAEDAEARKAYAELRGLAASLGGQVGTREELLAALQQTAMDKAEQAQADDLYYAWADAAVYIERQQQQGELFKQPEVLRYVASIQEFLGAVTDPDGNLIVGKSNSVADIVKTVHRALHNDQPEYFSIPDDPRAVAECLMQFQNAHARNADDIWHFITPDHREASLWLQLKTGDNVQMERVVAALAGFAKENPPPRNLQMKWFGLTYINVVWQDKMVKGMLFAFLGSFLVVFLMMTVLFRSALWGFLCMVPLTVTITLIYGMVGLIGKDYDMPVAVLSALALGLAVDFAIHFLEHSRVIHYRHGNWKDAAPHVFADPARAIVRNIIVIAVGFLPLLAAPLVPYKTVGVFLASILAISGAATLFLLPALIRLLERFLFPKSKVCCITCKCVTCIASSVALVILVVLNVKQFFEVGWTWLTWISLAIIPILALVCQRLGQREKCRLERLKGGADADQVQGSN